MGIFQEDVGDLVCLRTSNLEIALREVGDFQDDYATVRRLGNWGPQNCSKKSTENKLFNKSLDKQSESANVWP